MALREALRKDPAQAQLPPRARAIVDYALKLTLTPRQVSEADIAALRAQGISDAGIHDAASIAAYFNFVNRIALGLGVELEHERGTEPHGGTAPEPSGTSGEPAR